MMFIYHPNYQNYTEHAVAFIISREADYLKVEVFDNSSAIHDYTKEKQKPSDVFPKLVSNYVYEIKISDENIDKIIKAVDIGRNQFIKQKERADYHHDGYNPLKILSECAEKEYYDRHISSIQYAQKNCFIRQPSGALKYILAARINHETIMIDGKPATISKFKDLSTDDMNRMKVALAIYRLEKLGCDLKIRENLKEKYRTYNKLKSERQVLSKGIEKLSKYEKYATSNYVKYDASIKFQNKQIQLKPENTAFQKNLFLNF